jgi:uracil phosphoribosyltransferase
MQSSFHIVQTTLQPSKYERVLLTRLRDKNTSKEYFRQAANRLAELLVHRLVECLPSKVVTIETPLKECQGEVIVGSVELVSVMRAGDSLLDTFSNHFPDAGISKVLVQRDELTALPHFKYMKLSPTIAKGSSVVITEPMIATGGTLEMVIDLLKERGVSEEDIFIASICASPEGLSYLQNHFPAIKVVVTVIDEKLNEKKYIVPGLGDFGDRYFGT